ncbi:hypothetical protein B0H14DRAFT_2419606, partial [Mycena olivaceomarginata]
NYHDNYLRVLVSREGFMGKEPCCPCSQPVKYHCGECYFSQLFCCECLVEAHRLCLLCRIEVCSHFFLFDSQLMLRQLGLRVQLGHPNNTSCSRTHPGRAKFVVIVSNGFHHVSVDFSECQCSGSQLHWEQLLSCGWYPATPDNPQSAVTIAALKLFHFISLQGKTTLYYFFNALTKITDNMGSKTFKYRGPTSYLTPWFADTYRQHQYQLTLQIIRQ